MDKERVTEILKNPVELFDDEEFSEIAIEVTKRLMDKGYVTRANRDGVEITIIDYLSGEESDDEKEIIN